MPDLRWRLDLGKDGTHVVEIPAPRSGARLSFRCEGTQYSLGGIVNRGPQEASFVIAGHRATMTVTAVKLGAGLYLRRAVGTLGQRSPRILLKALAAALAGSASGARLEGTIAGSDAALAAQVWWRIYELAVDGSSVGAQVARIVGGKLESWTHVAPGGALPDGANPFWPEVGAGGPSDRTR